MFTMIANRSVAASESGNVPCPSSIGFMVAIAKLNVGQLVRGLADGDGAILQPFEERALRLQRDAVDFVEEDDFGRRQRTELGHQRAGRRVDHLEPDHLGRLQVGAALDACELGVADRREDDAEERLADARHAAQQEVAGVDLALLVLVVGRRNLGQKHDVGQRLRRLVSDERLASFRDDRFVKRDSFLEVWMHWTALVAAGRKPVHREADMAENLEMAKRQILSGFMSCCPRKGRQPPAGVGPLLRVPSGVRTVHTRVTKASTASSSPRSRR